MTLAMIEKPADLDQALEVALEGEIRELVRRDGGSLRRRPETDSEPVANNIGTLFQRVAGTSVQEIDGLITCVSYITLFARSGGSHLRDRVATSNGRFERPQLKAPGFAGGYSL